MIQPLPTNENPCPVQIQPSDRFMNSGERVRIVRTGGSEIENRTGIIAGFSHEYIRLILLDEPFLDANAFEHLVAAIPVMCLESLSS